MMMAPYKMGGVVDQCIDNLKNNNKIEIKHLFKISISNSHLQLGKLLSGSHAPDQSHVIV